MSHMLIMLVMAALIVIPGWMVEAGRPDLVAEVVAGRCREARVSWWGFDAEDSTRFLQAALDSGATRLIVDKMSSPWMSTPLKGASNQTVVFEPGAEIRAKRGAFLGKCDCLLTYDQKVNVVLEGPGTLRMWHSDYMSAPYQPAEWRHTLSFVSCSNVVVKGLCLVDSGGDGIYLGARGRTRKNTDVIIRDVVCRDNHRQGISVISAENLLIENTQLLTTHGTAPQAGIDFEPNHPQEVLKNCVMRNCLASGNAGYGFFTWVGQLNSTSEPVSLRFENCVSTGDRMSFGYAGRVGAEVPATLTIEGCRFEFPKDGVAVNIRENRSSPMKVELKDSVVVTNGEADPMVSPLGANWIAENLPRTADPEGFLPRVKLDYSQLRLQDDAPGKLIEFSPLRVRHQAKYLVYAGSARELRFRGRQIQVGHYALSKQPMRVMDVKGGLVTELPIPQTTSQDFGVKVPMAGFYRVEIDSGQGAFLLEAADAQVAIDGTDGLMNLIASEGTFGFWVPEGTNRFDFWATGSGAERVTVSLFCPAGGCVWRRADLGGNACSKQRHPQSGLWFVEVARPSKGCFEDSCYDLSGLPAVFYCRPGISE